MPVVSFSGLGSGIDIDTLVSGLVNASAGPRNVAQQRVSQTQAAVTAMSDIGTLLSDLKSAVDALDTASELSGFKGTSANTEALAISTTGAAKPGSYNVRVIALAQEQRTYSGTQTDANADLAQSGTLRLSQSGTDYDVTIEATDSLNDIAAKINATNAKLSASVFYDGSDYRLQLRGTETGVDGAFSISELSGVNLGLTAPDATKQAAQDAQIELDTFLISSKTNTVSGAIEGVSFDLKKMTSDSFRVSVTSDTDSMKKSLQTFVDKYNSVVNKIHSTAGFGDIKAQNTVLRADPTLRAITSGLSNQILSQAGLGGALDTFADLGIRLNNNGTLKIDDSKLGKALNENPDSFARALAGDTGSSGLMDKMSELLKGYTTFGSGLLSNSREALNARVKLYQDTVTREQLRLDTMSERLRKTLNAMDTKVSGYNNLASFVNF